ncbi:ClpXP protease specificity-enhancing factor [Solilutibacter silvestris]|uniref:Stringent starvation protein B n=1 Tax=Solilutibacter silvestris TaxID=1645665 RepID=A0A2K1Q320_9GAMM|nr:ClpXP protease specificity-enhancing factor [Lysobacter silvestris]PNS09449.1 Stringent starvation protein B [Lysobacter silvestris]
MTSQRPYLLRAIYEWIADNGMTPHLLVDAKRPGVSVPPSTVRDGQVVLNIADRAVGQLRMDNDLIAFNARFGGVSHAIFVPIDAVLAIYARETGMGMALPADPVTDADGGDEGNMLVENTDAPAPQPSPLRGVPTEAQDNDGGDDNTPSPTPPPKRGAHLKVVK